MLSTAAFGASACTTDTANQTSDTNPDKVRLPTYIPFETIKPDLAPTESGVLPGFLSHPSKPESVYPGIKPASGGTITALTQNSGVFPPAVERNAYWQELNNRLGAQLNMILASGADFPNKRATILAGGDLPDFTQITPMPQLPKVLASEFQDLSEFLSGDAIKDYPSLANIPTQSWRSSVYNGGIYGIPTHRGVAGAIMLSREDVRRDKGLTGEISTGDDFLELCRELTDAKNNRWATTEPLSILLFLQEMLGAPNAWREEGGRFTNTFETGETERAIDILTTMWREGLFYPDAFASPRRPIELIGTGTVSLINYGYSTWHAILLDYLPGNPKLEIGAIPPPRFDGGGLASKFLDSGIFSITAIKKQSKERTKELLRVADWIAAPFGSSENLFREYGIEGKHYTLDNGNPIPTSTGKTEVRVPTGLIAQRTLVLYEPGVPDAVKAQHAYQTATVPRGLPLPTVGLFSDTDVSKGAALTKSLRDVIADIVQGRKKLSDWKTAVADWKRQGGDAIRAEYEQSFQQK